jgi:hypothetical protein
MMLAATGQGTMLPFTMDKIEAVINAVSRN